MHNKKKYIAHRNREQHTSITSVHVQKTQTIYGESCTPALLSSVDTNQTVK